MLAQQRAVLVRWFLARFCAGLVAAFCAAAATSIHTNSGTEGAAQPISQPPLGNIGALMPAAAISHTDALPSVLRRGQRYELVMHVGVAGGQPRARVTVALAGADRSVCSIMTVQAGTIVTLRCAFVPTRVGVPGVRVSVLVVAGDAAAATRTFNHPVVATESTE